MKSRRVVVTAAEKRELWPGANALPFEADSMVQRLIDWHGPFTLEVVGACLGLTRERIRQVEESARRKFRANLEAEGFDADEVMQLLEERAALRDRRLS